MYVNLCNVRNILEFMTIHYIRVFINPFLCMAGNRDRDKTGRKILRGTNNHKNNSTKAATYREVVNAASDGVGNDLTGYPV